ncbi:hypothetical protein [Halovenus sp. HT40]|uniref:hypothetical protein n=1 Tax=Halovenus sp. HT40 TaxID=3126691 RepID=UPI00300E7600
MTEQTTAGGVVVTFHPQRWVETAAKAHESGRRQLSDAENRETTSFTVPRADATDQEGNRYPDESYEANQLVTHEQAPEWVTDWDGPYFVTTEASD